MNFFGVLHQGGADSIRDLLRRVRRFGTGRSCARPRHDDGSHPYGASFFSALFALNMALTTRNGWGVCRFGAAGIDGRSGFCRLRDYPHAASHAALAGACPQAASVEGHSMQTTGCEIPGPVLWKTELVFRGVRYTPELTEAIREGAAENLLAVLQTGCRVPTSANPHPLPVSAGERIGNAGQGGLYQEDGGSPRKPGERLCPLGWGWAALPHRLRGCSFVAVLPNFRRLLEL